ncbi:DMT family transporter [Pelagibacterium luteolum]|uniref:Permease of the drug/metabolite transporter (DMT) superfamily n=1 Tax=Pelagibacterium luteolum TaxID=440168 RepID=A0A1G7UR33_9HYPH|nr:DMT family transporter [Pelagibacterium luteolum]SDG49701.1 Permease of the drug/metabolite transporter (DMT) superfamily [Pelagibacterium luteolum]
MTAQKSVPFTASELNLGKGVGFLLAAMVIFGVQDAISKILVETYSPFQIVMIRYWAFFALAIWLVVRNSTLRRAFVSRAVGWQVARGVLLVVDIWFFAEALKTVALGDIGAINMVYPLLVTVFAIPLLGEKVGMVRMSAVLMGFAGALLIIRPGFITVELGVIYAVLSSAFYALYLVLTRKVSQVDTTTTSLFYVAVVGLVLTTAVGVFFWAPIAMEDLWMVGVLCLTMCGGHGLVMVSLRYAPASMLQPFNYFSLPWAITLGFVVFGTVIDGFALAGGVIIVVAGLAVMWRERQLAVKRPLMKGSAIAAPHLSPKSPDPSPDTLHPEVRQKG